MVSSKSSRKLLKSKLGSGHPSVILSDTSKSYEANFHAWGVDEEEGPLSYIVSTAKREQLDYALVERGANGDVPICTVGGVSESNEGPVICIFQEVAYTYIYQPILS